MEYKVITIGDKDFPIKFGFNALRKYSIMTNTKLADLQKIGEGMDLNSALTLCYCGIQDGCRVAKKKFDMTIDDLADLFDGNWDCMESVFSVLASQMTDGFDEKKKTPKKVKK
tara:strand:+ start:398 stop:736 length:339 start_codon:yes stop_codon:yes gene_type:complete